MSTRKIKASQLFDGHKIHTDKVLIINEDGTIQDVLPASEVVEDEIEHMDGILAPGFINAHCHVELSHLIGAIEMHTGLVDFVSKVIRLRSFEKSTILKATYEADQRMFENGIVAVGDICNTTDTIDVKQHSRIKYRNFIEVFGFAPEAAQQRFDTIQAQVYTPFYKQNVATTLVPHAPYSVSEPLFSIINDHLNPSDKTGEERIISIHNQETPEENFFFETDHSKFRDFYRFINTDISYYQPSGKSSLMTFLPWVNNASKVLLVHNTMTREDDIIYAEALAVEYHQELYWILCPGANLYIENKLPPVDLLLNNHCKIALGTDSLASNHALSILQEMKILKDTFTDLSTETLLTWATYNGACALGFQNELGSLKKGMRPGLILLQEDLSRLERIL